MATDQPSALHADDIDILTKGSKVIIQARGPQTEFLARHADGSTLAIENVEGNIVDVSDDGAVVVADVADIDFGANATVTDDGDQSVTVDVVDTHADVQEDGAALVADPSALNFTGSGVDAVDNGDGTVTLTITDTTTSTDTHTDVSDNGGLVVGDVADINFAANISVIDDGDGSVTVTSTDSDTHAHVYDDGALSVADVDGIDFGANATVVTDGTKTVTVDVTDTHADVSDDAALVVADAADLNFGANLSVTDDGDGSVTIDGADTTTANESYDRTVTGAATAGTVETLLADASGAGFAVTLPAPAADVLVNVKKIDGSANAVTVAPPGTETIDGAADYQLGAQYDAVTITSDGADYFIL